MIDNRRTGWAKSKKDESGPKKVEDLRKELIEKARMEEETRRYGDDDGG
jgi:hypothetical protein